MSKTKQYGRKFTGSKWWLVFWVFVFWPAALVYYMTRVDKVEKKQVK